MVPSGENRRQSGPAARDDRDMIRTASFSDDRRYRYRLGRRWGAGADLPWILLNPSAADDSGDDPTTRRVVSFSRSWGYGACTVVNLFAFRSADPTALLAAEEPVGHGNAVVVRMAIDDAAASGADRVVVGWGVVGQRCLTIDSSAAGRVRRVVAGATERWSLAGLRPVALGVTASGAPRHPLYVRGGTVAAPFADLAVTATTRTPPALAGGARR